MRLIDADALKKAIDKLFESGGYDSGLVMNTIDNAPTITPKLPTEVKKALEVLEAMKRGRWIPVSEQLPPNYILCLFCDKEGNIFYGYRKTNNLWYEEYQTYNISDVVAWQELPKPYKEGEKDETDN